MTPESVLNRIDVLILCGGLGKRLKAKIGESQKVMAQLRDRPFLDVVLEAVASQGFKKVVLCTGYKAETLEQYYRKKDFGLSIEFSKEEEPLDTGGAVKNAKRFVKSNPFFVLNGDSFCPLDFRKFLGFHKTKKALVSIVISRVNDNRDFGAITVDPSGRITHFKEKTKDASMNYVNAGIYCFEKDIFPWMPKEKQFSFENDFFPRLVGKNFYGFFSEENFIDIGTPQRYEEAKEYFRKAG